MYTRGYHHALPLFDLLSAVDTLRSKARHYQHVNVVACQCLAQSLAAEPQSLAWIRLESLEISLQVRVSIRIAVGNVHVIVLMLELNAKRQGVIVALGLSFHRVLVVADILAISVPAFAELASFNLGVH